ncbi:RNA polymerase sigma factor SigA [compost metagenome]
MVRLPINQVAAIAKINAAGLKLEQKLERAAGVEELAEYTGFTEQQVAGFMDAGLKHYSLDRTAEGEPGHSLLDMLADKSTRDTDHLVMGTSLLADLKRIIRRLPKREQKVLMMFYGINGNPPSSLEDMEIEFSLGSERLRQIKDKAQKTLRSKYRMALADYF